MELTSDLIAIQGILSSVIKNTGEFTKINYKGGNEDKILDVLVEIQKFISHPDRGYIREGKIVKKFEKQLQDIVFFLALNTRFKRTLELQEYSHLMNITPPLSKCLLVNIVYGLDLCECYCTLLKVFPLELSTELLEETIPCLQKSIPKVHLDNAYLILRAAATKLSSIDYSAKIEDDVDNVSEVTNIILQNISGMYSDQIKNWKAVQIYQHMGYCLLYLFELLLYCDEDCLCLKKFVRNVLRTCCSITKNVTINVFCAWAEIQEEDEALQTTVSSKAYLVIEKYQKYQGAKELISILGPIARKPSTLTELIHKADIPTMIRKINKNDQDQRSWFKALLNTNVFKNKGAIECLRSWCHLCSEDDVALLLDLCVESNNLEHKELVIKCAASLPTEKLVPVVTRHFYKHKFVNMAPSESAEEALAIMFNKLSDKGSDSFEELMPSVILLLLKTPELVLSCLYSECLKSKFYSSCLRSTFSAIREIGKSIGVSVLHKVIDENPPNTQNTDSYVELLRMLVETGYFTNEIVLLKVLYPLMERFHGEKHLETLSCALQIFVDANITLAVLEETKAVVTLLLTTMNEYRCRFLNFDSSKQHVVRHIVDIFCDNCRVNLGSEVELVIDGEDNFTGYYRKYLTSSVDSSLFKCMCSEFRIENYGGCVNQMLQILPPAVTREWLRIAEGIIENYGDDKCLELFTDVMILLAQLMETQTIQNSNHLFLALKYCIQNYGIVIHQRIQHNSSIELEKNVDRQVCRLLARLPNCLKEEEGLSLINILTDRSLKALAGDKEFLCHLILIRNAKICQVLAQKITNT